MSDYIDRIHDMVFELTKIVAETKERGLMELWTMVVGSTIIPELLKGAPDFLETNPEYKEIVEAYTREKVLEKMAPKTVEVPVEKTVEKIVEVPVEKTVERIIHVESAGRSEPLHEPCMDGGKHRRLKDKVE